MAFVSPPGSETDTDTEFFPSFTLTRANTLTLIVNKFFYPPELNDKNMIWIKNIPLFQYLAPFSSFKKYFKFHSWAVWHETWEPTNHEVWPPYGKWFCCSFVVRCCHILNFHCGLFKIIFFFKKKIGSLFFPWSIAGRQSQI